MSRINTERKGRTEQHERRDQGDDVDADGESKPPSQLNKRQCQNIPYNKRNDNKTTKYYKLTYTLLIIQNNLPIRLLDMKYYPPINEIHINTDHYENLTILRPRCDACHSYSSVNLATPITQGVAYIPQRTPAYSVQSSQPKPRQYKPAAWTYCLNQSASQQQNIAVWRYNSLHQLSKNVKNIAK